MTRAQYIRMGVSAGYTVKEALLAAPGEVYDILELNAKAVEKQKKQGSDFV